MNCDPTSLMAASACLKCIPKGRLQEVWTYLWCKVAAVGLNKFDWPQRVVANGGAMPSAPTIAAMTTFNKSLTSCGILSKMISVCCFVPDNLVAGLTPLIKVAGNDPWTGHAIAPGDLTLAGIKGNGINGYIDTGIIPSSAFSSDVSDGITMYLSTAVNSVLNDNGCSDLTNLFKLQSSDITGSAIFWNWDGTASGKVSGANPNWTGFISASRIAANDVAIYKANSLTPFASIATGVSTSGTRPARSFYMLAQNQNNSPLGYSTDRFSFAAVHLGLTSAETQCLYNAVQALRVALGGGFV